MSATEIKVYLSLIMISQNSYKYKKNILRESGIYIMSTLGMLEKDVFLKIYFA